MEHAPPKHRECWRLLGSGFLFFGIFTLLVNAAGGWALVEGPGTKVWNTFVRVLPGTNYGSQLTLYAFCTLLVTACLRGQRAGPLPGRTVWGVLLLGTAAGTAIGLLEGPFTLQHLANFALLNTGLLLLLLSALAVAVVTGAADRLFALALAAYTAGYPLTTLWLSWRAHNSPGSMTPPVLYTHLYFIAFILVALGITTYRWLLAGRGIPVPAVLPRPLAGPASARMDSRMR
jgi:hypothetical protein